MTATTRQERERLVAEWLTAYLASYALPANYADPLYGQSHEDVATNVGPVIAEHLLDVPALADLLDAADERDRIVAAVSRLAADTGCWIEGYCRDHDAEYDGCEGCRVAQALAAILAATDTAAADEGRAS